MPRFYSLEMKIELLDRVINKEEISSILSDANVPPSTLRGWIKDSKKIRKNYEDQVETQLLELDLHGPATTEELVVQDGQCPGKTHRGALTHLKWLSQYIKEHDLSDIHSRNVKCFEDLVKFRMVKELKQRKITDFLL